MTRKPSVKSFSIRPRDAAAPPPPSPRKTARELDDRQRVGTYVLLRKSLHDRPHRGVCGHTVNLWEVHDVDEYIMVHADVCLPCQRVRVVRCPEVDQFEMAQAPPTVVQAYVAHLTERHGWRRADFPPQILARAQARTSSLPAGNGDDEDEVEEASS